MIPLTNLMVRHFFISRLNFSSYVQLVPMYSFTIKKRKEDLYLCFYLILTIYEILLNVHQDIIKKNIAGMEVAEVTDASNECV